MPSTWKDEICGLHAFFEAWYRGEAPDTDAAFSRVADVIAPDYTLISATGSIADRGQLLDVLRSQHGAMPDLVLTVDDLQLRLNTDSIVLATYKETGTTRGETRSTVITAVLRRQPGLPHDLAWVHIHETHLPPPS